MARGSASFLQNRPRTFVCLPETRQRFRAWKAAAQRKLDYQDAVARVGKQVHCSKLCFLCQTTGSENYRGKVDPPREARSSLPPVPSSTSDSRNIKRGTNRIGPSTKHCLILRERRERLGRE